MVWHSDPRSQDGCRKDTERDGISIKLPNGHTLTNVAHDSRSIARQLWHLGSYPGATPSRSGLALGRELLNFEGDLPHGLLERLGSCGELSDRDRDWRRRQDWLLVGLD